jgi:hypothetical protein
MDRPEPDLAGFREAQLTLVAKTGADVPFFTPVPKTYPPGTLLDPEAGTPYDPTIQPQASGFASASVRCGVAIRPIDRAMDDKTVQSALGLLEEGQGVLIVPSTDYDENDLDHATEVEVHGDRWEITQRTPDGIANVDYRRLVYIRQL